MTTTGELNAIIEELELIDIGDAASYLGEEATVVDDYLTSEYTAFAFVNGTGALMKGDCYSCPMRFF